MFDKQFIQTFRAAFEIRSWHLYFLVVEFVACVANISNSSVLTKYEHESEVM